MKIAKLHTGLLQVERIQRDLAACTRVDEVKKIKDQVEAIRLYLRKQGAERSIQNEAAEAALRTTRRLGELLEEQDRAKPGDNLTPGPKVKGSSKSHGVTSKKPTLKDIGIGRMEASRAVEVAKVPAKRFEKYVEETKKAGAEVTHAGFRREVGGEVRRQERVEKLVEIARGDAPIPTGFAHYPVIYADPPWRYEHVETESRAIENQYPTMALDAIKALPIVDLATPDAVLFLWATSPKLAEALEVVAAWGFTYRTSMVWVKRQIGMGYYARQRHELLLIATRGNPPTPLPAARPDSVITADRAEHSAKPAEFAHAIECMYPELPRIELFCRTPRPGWAVWGNQAA